jgi:hypothetical protein
VEGIILTGDFNTAVKESNSPSTDNGAASMKEWIKENQHKYAELSPFFLFPLFCSPSVSLSHHSLSFNRFCLNLLNFLVLFISLYLLF